jgi:hypothetical protein
MRENQRIRSVSAGAEAYRSRRPTTIPTHNLASMLAAMDLHFVVGSHVWSSVNLPLQQKQRQNPKPSGDLFTSLLFEYISLGVKSRFR